MTGKKDQPVSFWVPLLLSWALILTAWCLTPQLVAWRVTAADDAPSPAATAAVPSETSREVLTAGTYGDQFGSINALFSGLALATIAISLWYQRQDIQIQQKALIDQKGVFERQLRLAATSEIADSLPNFNFKCYDTASGFKIEVRNTGTEVYGLNIHLGSTSDWRFNILGLAHYMNNAPLEVFEVSPKHSKALKDTVSVSVIISFTLRSGEEVIEPYYFHYKLKQMERARPLRATIEELLTRQQISTPQPAGK